MRFGAVGILLNPPVLDSSAISPLPFFLDTCLRAALTLQNVTNRRLLYATALEDTELQVTAILALLHSPRCKGQEL